METQRLGNSDLKITPVGFGAWAIGGSGWEFAWARKTTKIPSRQSIARSNWA